VIHLNDERFWHYAAVHLATNRLLHVNLSPTRNQAITDMFLAELREKHLVDDALFRRFCTVAASGTPPTQLPIPIRKHGNRNSVERVFRELKRRTSQFSNCFSHAEAETVENWLQAFAFTWNQLI